MIWFIKVGDESFLDINNFIVIKLVKLGVEVGRDFVWIFGFFYVDRGIFKCCWLVM